MDEAAEAVVAFDIGGRHDGERDRVNRAVGRSLVKALVRPGLVVVVDELGQHSLQVPPAEDQQVVEQLPTYGANPALGDRVGVSLRLRMVPQVRDTSRSRTRSTR